MDQGRDAPRGTGEPLQRMLLDEGLGHSRGQIEFRQGAREDVTNSGEFHPYDACPRERYAAVCRPGRMVSPDPGALSSSPHFLLNVNLLDI